MSTNTYKEQHTRMLANTQTHLQAQERINLYQTRARTLTHTYAHTQTQHLLPFGCNR